MYKCQPSPTLYVLVGAEGGLHSAPTPLPVTAACMQVSDSQDVHHGMVCEVMDGLFSVFMEEVCAWEMERGWV